MTATWGPAKIDHDFGDLNFDRSNWFNILREWNTLCFRYWSTLNSKSILEEHLQSPKITILCSAYADKEFFLTSPKMQSVWRKWPLGKRIRLQCDFFWLLNFMKISWHIIALHRMMLHAISHEDWCINWRKGFLDDWSQKIKAPLNTLSQNVLFLGLDWI